MFTADTGGNVSRVVHMYHFENYSARDATRRAAAAHADWQRYTDAARSCILTKESTILLQAPADVYAAAGIGCASGFQPAAAAAAGGAGGSSADQVVYELRNYRLRPGRNGVKALMAAFKTGLPSKLAADGVGQLALLAHSDVGQLNQVYEVYRYPSAQRLIEACERSRGAAEWQDAKSKAYELCDQFHISFLHPTRFSRWQ
ncbi:hypothetical protein CHLRE_12g516000v5 [Chlamydomonas reinhardtii]|uniref:NIPSNAP domain-containing protein n=1 Tax=Chlamydomonas reinhardtii TaxID=3055 RepID=A0A2K3D3T0_CHLRE|nr:uncharacterized protein CHLRE_12g516000v5 [Chlamydomonas reinhardtii]PNW75177.1 hypothetical protein CHLRE_12g516000v5 [Chlamydomonas reinhardtii]